MYFRLGFQHYLQIKESFKQNSTDIINPVTYSGYSWNQAWNQACGHDFVCTVRRYVGPRSRQRGHWKSDTRSTKPLEETYTKADKSLELHLSSKAFNNIVTKYHFRSLSFECVNFIHVFRTESKVTKLV